MSARAVSDHLRAAWRRRWLVPLVALLVLHVAGLALLAAGWPLVGAAVFAGAHGALVLGTVLPNVPWLGALRRSAGPDAERRGEVWLTFDDGPCAETTPAVLEVLRAHGARATFFVVGARVAQHPELVRRIAADGHEVASHTQTHAAGVLWAAGPRRWRRELAQAADAIEAAIGVRPIRLRAPAGLVGSAGFAAAAAAGQELVGWSARGLDTLSRSADLVLGRLRPRLRPGAVILLHDRPTRAGADFDPASLAAAVLAELAARGLRCAVPPLGP